MYLLAARIEDAIGNPATRLARWCVDVQTLFARSLHIKLDIDAIQKRSGYFRAIVFDPFGAARTVAPWIAEITAGAGIHGPDQLEACRKVRLPLNPRYRNLAGFERLTQNIKNMPGEFR